MTAIEKTRLQVPMSKKMRTAWEARALDLGFDSIQAYIRFIAKADLDGRRVDFNAPRELSPEAAIRYNKMVDEIEENPQKHLSGQGRIDSPLHTDLQK